MDAAGRAGTTLDAAVPRSAPPPPPGVSLPTRQARGLAADALHRLLRDPAAMVGLVIVLLMAGMAVAAPLVTRHDPLKQALVERLKPPSQNHPFGTDNLGRDVYSRVVYGGGSRCGLASSPKARPCSRKVRPSRSIPTPRPGMLRA